MQSNIGKKKNKNKDEGHILPDFMTHITTWFLINQDRMIFA